MDTTPAKGHKLVFGGIFLLIAVLIGVDAVGDFNATGLNWHIGLEIVIGAISASAFCWLVYSRDSAMNQLQVSQAESQRWQEEAKRWKQDSQVFVEGLSKSIDRQFNEWHFSPAEKDVALLLIKGLSLREISQLRKTSEKTIQAQSLSIYGKASVRGRNELAAFFLEDLLAPVLR